MDQTVNEMFSPTDHIKDSFKISCDHRIWENCQCKEYQEAVSELNNLGNALKLIFLHLKHERSCPASEIGHCACESIEYAGNLNKIYKQMHEKLQDLKVTLTKDTSS